MSVLGDPRVRLAGLVALAVLVLDQATKAMVEQWMPRYPMAIHLVPGVDLIYVRNKGAAFGIFNDVPDGVRVPLFLGVTVLALVTLIAWVRRAPEDQPWFVAALGGILGGALGNLVCRMLRGGEVIDFVDVHLRDLHWPAFNVADSAITVGVLVVVLSGLRERRESVAA